MKRFFWIVAIIIVLIATTGAIYWLGFRGNDDEPLKSGEAKQAAVTDLKAIIPTPQDPTLDLTQELLQETTQDSAITLPSYYFVSKASVPVYVQPTENALVDGTAYYGEKLRVMEHSSEWIRIAPIYQMDEGEEEVSQWVRMSDLSTDAVSLTGKKWNEVLSGYLFKSDDFNQHQERFIEASTELLESKRCRLYDFEQVGGWIKSLNHPDDVYFTYCGGIEVSNKVYLNTTTGVVF
ncbi:hypothetical protein [Vibrio methylphosphonaticus]|uniref:hypothetical protein n=1 Tax=Vibrio methylphosphonaticus TaxID=2946866 RepID=UPI00202AA2D3|nr:hypothetical protein [Vibrio methylphosphonaticus]MCL9773665.1 hypothetical protein [Vibrio methylphosphonaticus]